MHLHFTFICGKEVHPMATERNHGIDFLRLVLMFMVCVLHVLGKGGVLASCQEGTLQYGLFWLLEVFVYCAVDGFALISGYMATSKPLKPVKLVDMWFQVFFYSLILSLILILCGINTSFNARKIIQWSLPVTGNVFWYFTAYVPCFFAAPFFSKAICEMKETTAQKTFLIIILLFSGLGVLTDPFKSDNGYSAIWIMALYCIGALAKRIRLFETKKTAALLFLLLLSVLCAWGVFLLTGIQHLINFHSPTVLLTAIILVVLFSRMPLKLSGISKLSSLSFGIYLFQLNPVIWNTIIDGHLSFIASRPAALGVLYVFAFALMIFSAGLLVEAIRSKLAGLINLHSLSGHIVTAAESLLLKAAYFLK